MYRLKQLIFITGVLMNLFHNDHYFTPLNYLFSDIVNLNLQRFVRCVLDTNF